MNNADNRGRWGWNGRGLRTRYVPRTPLCRSLVVAAPWLNVIILLGAFAAIQSRVVLRPGIVMQLPETTMADGSGPGVTAVITSHKTGGGEGGRIEMVFFDDEPFAVQNAAQMAELGKRFQKKARENPDAPLVIEADLHVGYGTIVAVCDMARSAGFPVANLAQRVVEAAPGEK